MIKLLSNIAELIYAGIVIMIMLDSAKGVRNEKSRFRKSNYKRS